MKRSLYCRHHIIHGRVARIAKTRHRKRVRLEVYVAGAVFQARGCKGHGMMVAHMGVCYARVHQGVYVAYGTVARMGVCYSTRLLMPQP